MDILRILCDASMLLYIISLLSKRSIEFKLISAISFIIFCVLHLIFVEVNIVIGISRILNLVLSIFIFIGLLKNYKKIYSKEVITEDVRNNEN